MVEPTESTEPTEPTEPIESPASKRKSLTTMIAVTVGNTSVHVLPQGSVRFGGHVMTGGMGSMMWTVWKQFVELPQQSFTA